MIPGASSFATLPMAVGAASEGAVAALAALRFSDLGWVSAPSDSIPNTPWAERAQDPGLLARQVPLTPDQPDRRGSFEATLELNNTDGALDSAIAGYAIDGRRVVLKIGKASGPYEDFQILFDGTAKGWRVSGEHSVQVTLRDSTWRLDMPVQTTLYGGGGGLAGGDDLKGKPKPLTYGECKNVTAVLVDPSLLIYQVHDGAIQSIDDVYDRGAALSGAGDVGDIVAASNPSAGTYITQVSGGYFRLGSTPAGLITADVQGDADPSYIDVSSDILHRILTTRAGLLSTDIEGATFDALANLQPAAIGVHVGTSPATVAQIMNQVLHGIGGWWAADRLGLIRVGRLQAPGGSKRMTLTVRELLAVQRLDLPENVSPPNWRRRVAWGRNWTVQPTDLAGSVTAARRAFLAEADRMAIAADTSVRIKHLLASDPDPVPGLFAEEAAAASEATRLLALHGADRQLFVARLKFIGYRLEFGDIVELVWPRYGLDAGVLATVAGIRIDTGKREVELDLFV
jgi:hypothetical protein